MHFDFSLIDSYTIDELLVFVKKGDVTLEDLRNHLTRDNLAIWQLLRKRIWEYKRLKEKDDWISVRELSSDKIKEFLRKYPHSHFANEALDRIKTLEERERIIREQIRRERDGVCYCPNYEGSSFSGRGDVSPVKKCTYIPQKVLNWFKGKNDSSEIICNSAVFAPAEIVEGDDMLVQVYIYKDEETEQVVIDSRMSDEDATQRSYTPLNFKIKNGDIITVNLDMHGLSVDGETSKNIVWQNKFTKCSFFAYVPMHYPKYKAKGDIYISVNGLELGRMSFFSKLKEISNDNICCEVLSKSYKKVFISYSHKDNDTVKAIAEAYHALGLVEYFYDRHSLSPGEIYEKKIYEFIDNSDLFLLCWSENAARSEWVKKERIRAFYAALDEPPRLRLYPINISPYSPPPPDMIKVFHFADYDKLIETKI